MNFLAHLFLSGDNEDLLIGNFVADFIRNKDVASYSSQVQAGIALHRQIDSFTDNHETVRLGTHRLQPHHRKYAPVVIDVLYDYLLAQNWASYSPIPLGTYTSSVYEILERRMDEMPPRLKKRLPEMMDKDWLQAYGTEAGLRYTFSRMDQRTAFPSNFVAAYDHLRADYDLYNKEFNTFFPEVIQFVKEWVKNS